VLSVIYKSYESLKRKNLFKFGDQRQESSY